MGPFSSSGEEDLNPSRLLILGAYHGRADVIKEALRLGADPNAASPSPYEDSESDFFETALHVAVRSHSRDCIRILLSAGGDIGRDSDGRSGFSLVNSDDIRSVWNEEMCRRAGQGDLKGLQRLLDDGVEINATDGLAENTLMHWASSFGQVDVVKTLIFRDANLDAKNALGMTPLMDAVKAGKKDVVKVLMDAGASLDISVTQGKDGGKIATDFTTDSAILSVLRRKRRASKTLRATTSRTSIQDDPEKSETNVPGGRQNSMFDLTPRASRGPTNDEVDAERYFESNVTKLPEWARLLWPRPQKFVSLPSTFTLPKSVTISHDFDAISESRAFISSLKAMFQNHDFEVVAFNADIRIAIDPTALRRPSSFQIHVRSRIDVRAADQAGLFYGLTLLTSMFTVMKSKSSLQTSSSSDVQKSLSKAERDADIAPISIPGCIIEDSPTISTRAALLDISGRSLKLETISRVIKLLSRLRYNCIHLNSALGNELSYESLLTIKSLCHTHHMDFVPCIDLTNIDLKRRHQKMVDALDNIRRVIKALGAKTVRLNFGRDTEFPYDSADANVSIRSVMDICKMFNDMTVYYPAGILIQVLDACASYEEEEEVVMELPERAIAIVEAGVRTFEADTEKLSKHGLGYFVSVSTDVCNSFAGRVEHFGNSIAECKKQCGGRWPRGITICDWGGVLHLQPLTASYISWAVGAGLAWSGESGISLGDPSLPKLVDCVYFRGVGESSALGKILCALGNSPKELYEVVFNSREVERISEETVRQDLRRARRAIEVLRRYDGPGDRNDVEDIRLMAAFAQMAAEVVLLTEFEESRDDRNGTAGLSDCSNHVIQCIEEYEKMMKRCCEGGSSNAGVETLKQVLEELKRRREYSDSAQSGWMTLLTQ